MTRVSDFAKADIFGASSPLEMRDRIVNGNFASNVGTPSQTASGCLSLVHWHNLHEGMTVTTSQQSFGALSQTEVPGFPVYMMRTVMSASSPPATHYCVRKQRIEDVSTFSGESAVIEFWARGSAPLKIGVELQQRFTTGGSADVLIPVGVIDIDDTWKRFELAVAAPSISGKTFSGQFTFTSSLDLNFWLSAGSNHAARSGIGPQVGTIEIASVRMEQDALGPLVHVPAHVHVSRCRRYHQFVGYRYSGVAGAAGQQWGITLPYSVQMRTTPTYTVNPAGNTNAPTVAELGSASQFVHLHVTSAAAGAMSAVGTVTLNAEFPDTTL